MGENLLPRENNMVSRRAAHRVRGSPRALTQYGWQRGLLLPKVPRETGPAAPGLPRGAALWWSYVGSCTGALYTAGSLVEIDCFRHTGSASTLTRCGAVVRRGGLEQVSGHLGQGPPWAGLGGVCSV